MHRAKLLYPRSQHTRAVASTQPWLSAPVKHTVTSMPPIEEGAHATIGAPTSHKIRRDRRVAPVHRGQGRSTDHASTVTNYRAWTPLSTKRHVANPCTAPVPPFDYKRE